MCTTDFFQITLFKLLIEIKNKFEVHLLLNCLNVYKIMLISFSDVSGFISGFLKVSGTKFSDLFLLFNNYYINFSKKTRYPQNVLKIHIYLKKKTIFVG